MNAEFYLGVAGALQIAIAAMHLYIPKRFQWKEELSRLSLLNRQIFVVHTIFICYVLLLMGSLSLFAPGVLLEPTPLSRLVLAGFASFWGLRLAFQLFVYDARLWRGNRFNTLAHAAFTLIWLYLAATYAGILFFQG